MGMADVGLRRDRFRPHCVPSAPCHQALQRCNMPGHRCAGAIGLDGRRAPLTSVEAMAERYLRDIRSIQQHGPYRVCGVSFGGLVAFVYLLIRSTMGRFTPAQATSAIVVSYYWHFVDVVWIGLFATIYLIR